MEADRTVYGDEVKFGGGKRIHRSAFRNIPILRSILDAGDRYGDRQALLEFR